MDIVTILVFLVISVILIFEAGVSLKTAPHVAAIASFFGLCSLLIVVVSAKGSFGTLYDNTLDHKTFVVKSRVVDGSGKKSVFVLYDLVHKKNRLAEFTTYPPNGYKETVTADGGVLLAPVK